MKRTCNQRFTFWRGWYDFIQELDTEREQLEAYNTICQMAFQGEDGYECPIREDGVPMTPLLRVRRQIYHMLHGILWRQDSDKRKRSKCSDSSVGRGRPLKGETASDYYERTEQRRALLSDEMSDGDEQLNGAGSVACNEEMASVGDEEQPLTIHAGDMVDDCSEVSLVEKRQAKKMMKESIWEERIKSWKDLQDFIKKGYFGSHVRIAISEDFCKHAFFQLSEVQKWKNVITKRPIQSNLIHVISGLVNQYRMTSVKNLAADKRVSAYSKKEADKAKRQEDAEKTSEDIANIERQRELDAEARARELGLM